MTAPNDSPFFVVTPINSAYDKEAKAIEKFINELYFQDKQLQHDLSESIIRLVMDRFVFGIGPHI